MSLFYTKTNTGNSIAMGKIGQYKKTGRKRTSETQKSAPNLLLQPITARSSTRTSVNISEHFTTFANILQTFRSVFIAICNAYRVNSSAQEETLPQFRNTYYITFQIKT
jgi:hypothetical protein